MNDGSRAKPGRPRDPRVDQALLKAGLEVFLERGYQHASVAEIARRAGVGTPAVYRRWPRKANMGMDILVSALQDDPMPDTGNIRNDLLSLMRLRLEQWKDPFLVQLFLPMVLEAYGDAHVAQIVRERFRQYRNPRVIARLRKAVEAGEIRADIDPGRLLEQMQGSIAIPVLFMQDLPDEAELLKIVDAALEGYGTKAS